MVGNHTLTVNGTDFAAERKPFILFAVSEQRANVHSVCFHDEKKRICASERKDFFSTIKAIKVLAEFYKDCQHTEKPSDSTEQYTAA